VEKFLQVWEGLVGLRGREAGEGGLPLGRVHCRVLLLLCPISGSQILETRFTE
jgi:hypothetical protein